MNPYYAGVLSGTSMDAIDTVVVDFSTSVPSLLAAHSYAYEETLKSRLVKLVGAGPGAALGETMAVHRKLGEAFADAVNDILRINGLSASVIAAIGLHGQTVLHAPDADPGYSVQLGDPNSVARNTGITTVADFRGMDIASGGQGAPLAPLLHARLLASSEEDRAVLNLGGIANLTLLPAGGAVSGFDTGPANCLLDAWSVLQRQAPFDRKGDWGSSGQCDTDLLTECLADPYFSRQPPKSTGTDYFNLGWLQQRLGDRSIAPEDVQATLGELTARTVAEAAPDNFQRLLVCGGGVHNADLMARLQSAMGAARVESTAAHGMDPDWMEGLLFAWLAQQRLQETGFDVQGITGAAGPEVLGAVYQPGGRAAV